MINSVYLTSQNNFKHCVEPQSDIFFSFYAFKKALMISQ